MAAATTAARAKTVAVKALNGVVGMLGGPSGVAMLAAWGMYELASSFGRAKDEADEAKKSIAGLNDEIFARNWSQAQKDALDYSKKIMDQQEKLAASEKQLAEAQAQASNQGTTGFAAYQRAKGSQRAEEIKKEIQDSKSLISSWEQLRTESLNLARDQQRANKDTASGVTEIGEAYKATGGAIAEQYARQNREISLKAQGREREIEYLELEEKIEAERARLMKDLGMTRQQAVRATYDEYEVAAALIGANQEIEASIERQTENRRKDEEAARQTAAAAQSIRGAIATPQDEYNRQIKDAKALLDSGAISQGEFTRAVVVYGEQLEAAIQKEDRRAASLNSAGEAVRAYAADLEHQRQVAEAMLAGNDGLVRSLETQRQVMQALGDQATPAQTQALIEQQMAVDSLRQSAEEFNATVQRGVGLYESSKTQAQQLAEDQEALNAAYRVGKLDAEQYSQALEHVTKQGQEANEIAREVGRSLTGAFSDAILEGKELQDVLQGLAKDLGRIVLQHTVMGPFEDWFTGLNIFGGVTPAATAATVATSGAMVNTDGGTLPFGNGGIIPPATFTPLPISGTSKSSFGTSSAGSTSNTVVQIIDRRRGGTVETEEETAPDGTRIVRAFIRDEMRKSLQPGGESYKQIQSTFKVATRLGGR